MEWQNWGSKKLFVNVDPKAFLQKQARLVWVSKTLLWNFHPFHHAVTELTLKQQELLGSFSASFSNWDSGYSQLSLHCRCPDNCRDISFLSSLKETFRQKTHSSRKCPRPSVTGWVRITVQWLFPCMVEAAFHGLITQRKNKPEQTHRVVCLFFPTC